MNCPNCQAHCGDTDRFCYLCGSVLQPVPQPKKGSRRIPALLLVVMSVAGLIIFFITTGNAAPVRADRSMPWFYVRGGVLYFEPHRYTGGSELTVPSEIAGQEVLALSEDCFAGCTELTTVYLPGTLATIGDGAFSGCTSLRGIFLPASVNVIGEEAFYGCSSLEAICIHNRLGIIYEDAFDDCNRLTFIFFLGTYAEWTSLYSEFINPYTAVFCADGSFFQGGDPHK